MIKKTSSKILVINVILLTLLIAGTFFLFNDKLNEFHRQSFVEQQFNTGRNLAELSKGYQLSKSDSTLPVEGDEQKSIQLLNHLFKKVKERNSHIHKIYSIFYNKDSNSMYYASQSDIYDHITVSIDIGLNNLKINYNLFDNKIYINHNYKIYNNSFEIINDKTITYIDIQQDNLSVHYNETQILKFNPDGSATVNCSDIKTTLMLSGKNNTLETKCTIKYTPYLIKYNYYLTGQSDIQYGDKFQESPELLNSIKQQVIDQNQEYIYSKLFDADTDLIKTYIPISDKLNQVTGFICIETFFDTNTFFYNDLEYSIIFFLGLLLIILIILKYFIDFFIKKPSFEILESINQAIDNDQLQYRSHLNKNASIEFQMINHAIEEYLLSLQQYLKELEQSVFDKNKELHETILNLKEQENRIQQIIQQSPSGMIITNHENIIELVNPVTSRIFSIPPEELNHKKLDFILPTITKEYCSHCQYKICESQYNVCQISINTRLNKNKQLLISRSQIVDHNNNYVTLHMIHDLTELKNKDREYLNLLNSISECLLIHRAGLILFVNYALVHKLGYSEQDLYNRYLESFVIEGEQESLHTYINQSYAEITRSVSISSKINHLHLTFIHKNGTLMKANISSQEYFYQNQKVELMKIKFI